MKSKLMLLLLILSLFTLLNAASISGRITDEQGAAIAQSHVVLQSDVHVAGPNGQKDPETGSGHPERSTFTDANGSYTFADISIGEYVVVAGAMGYSQTPYTQPNSEEIYVIEIDADEQEVQGVDIQLVRAGNPHGDMGSVSGYVYDVSGIGLARIPVGVAPVGQPGEMAPFRIAVTNMQGEYAINNLRPGNYIASIMNLNSMQPTAGGVAFTISEELSNVQNINLTMTVTGRTVSGVLYSPEGQPLEQGYLELFSATPHDSTTMFVRYETRVTEAGVYSFSNVLPGNYKLVTYSQHSRPLFYPGVWDVQNAEVITVGENDITGADIHFPTLESYTISGIVTDSETGTPIPNIRIRATVARMHNFGEGFQNEGPCDQHGNPNQHPEVNDFEFVTLTDAAGLWTLHVPTGDYFLSAADSTHVYRMQYYYNTPNFMEATMLHVVAPIDTLNFQMLLHNQNNPCSISGTITEGGAAPEYPVLVVAVSSDEDWDDVAITDLSGNYTIRNLRPGTYYVVACSPLAPPVYYSNAIDWETAQQVTVSTPVSGIDFDLVIPTLSGPSTLSGTIYNAAGVTMANVTIALQNDQNETVAFARTDSNGQYAISNLVNQTYRAIVTKLRVPTLTQNIVISGEQNQNFTLSTALSNDDPAQSAPVQKINLTNYPNPFNPETTISFTLSKATSIRADIYNLKGQKIRTLTNEMKASGNQSLVWNGKDDAGKSVANGIYLCKVRGDGFSSSRKMALIK